MSIRVRTWAYLVVALAVVAALQWLDQITGPDYGFALVYLVPVVVAGWWIGRGPALVVAVAASAAWLLALPGTTEGLLPGPRIWNAFSRLVIFAGAAWVTGQLRRDRRGLEEANRRLSVLLDRERDLARSDYLTGLLNWRGLSEYIEREIPRAHREGRGLCIAYVDIDNFKRVNDLHGHDTGDALLRECAEQLRSAVRAGDVVGRIGGDEFVVLFAGDDSAGVGHAGERMVEAIRALGSQYPETRLGASVGIAHFVRPPSELARLIAVADAVLYQAKSDGKGRVVVRHIEPADAA